MAINNIDRVGRALDVLGSVLEPFVARVLANHVPEGTDWSALLAAKDGREGGVYERNDPQLQLRAITERMGSLGFPFGELLSRGEQNLAGEMREVRNSWAHRKSFTADDTYRALDTCERLLRAIGAPSEADAVRKLKADAQRTAYAEETRRDVRAAVSSMPELADAELTPWRKVLAPHADIAAGDFARAEFAADLHRVAAGEGAPEYVDPIKFFERTYLTGGLKTLLTMTAKRISGDPNAQSVINLQTTFGGGKTHSMLATWHLFSGRPLADYPQDVQDLLGAESATLLEHEVKRVAIVGNEMSPGQPSIKPDGTVVNTLWGELAWQLGGAEGYAIVSEADRTGTNPGAALRDVIARYSPALILIDEWVAYARGLYGREDLVGGTFDTQFTFAQQLTEVVKSVPGALLLVSIPASDALSDDENATASDLEIGGANGRAALQRLQHVVTRVAHNWTPASSGESFEIVRRRLFTEPDAAGRRQIELTVRRFAEYYRGQAGELPSETRQVEYESRLRAAYPVHPELFDRLYGDWSALERFQRTRGVLRMMSAVVHSLYSADDDSPLIMPGSMPLDDPAVRDEVSAYLDDVWRTIIERDIDGDNAIPLLVDRERPLFGRRALTRRIARAVFLGSAATADSGHKGIERQRIFLGVAMPGDTIGNFGSSLQMLSDQATYLYSEGTRFWYDRQPSVNRMVIDRARALDVEDVYAKAVTLLKATAGSAPEFASVIVAPETTADVQESESVRLVVAHPRYVVTGKNRESAGWEFARDLMKNRGSSARQSVNTLIVLAADQGRWQEVEDALRTHMAWAQVAAAVGELDLTHSQADHARRRETETRKIVDQRLASAWIWAFYPTQVDGTQPLGLDMMKVEGEERRLAVRAGSRLGREGVVYTETSAISLTLTFDRYLRSRWNRGHLSIEELWKYHLQYPYMPRLRDKNVLLDAVRAVMSDVGWTNRGFALASGYDETSGDYLDLRIPLEDEPPAIVDDSTLLVVPRLASEQAARRHQVEASREPVETAATVRPGEREPEVGEVDAAARRGDESVSRVANARFEGEVDLKPQGDLAAQLRTVLDEVLVHLKDADPDTFEIRVSISADRSEGFDSDTVRTVSENSRSIGFALGRFKEL